MLRGLYGLDANADLTIRGTKSNVTILLLNFFGLAVL